jgi:molybdenum cofactor biosynthesis enzyme MoaA
LVHSLQLIKEKNKFKKIIYTTVEKVLSQQISNFKIQTVNIKSINDRKIDVDLVLSLPENVNFYKTFKNELTYGLTRAT